MSCRLASLRLRDSRCLSAHEGQRVSPVMTVLEQLTHRPCSIRSARRLAYDAHWYSFLSWYVRWSFPGFAAFFVLVVRAGVFLLGLRFLRLDGGLPPEFCGFGSVKVNSKVPPIVRVCGGVPSGVHVAVLVGWSIPVSAGVLRPQG